MLGHVPAQAFKTVMAGLEGKNLLESFRHVERPKANIGANVNGYMPCSDMVKGFEKMLALKSVLLGYRSFEEWRKIVVMPWQMPTVDLGHAAFRGPLRCVMYCPRTLLSNG